MGLGHKLIRMIEQPSILKEKLYGIDPGHAKSYLFARKILGEVHMLIDVGANKGRLIKAFKFYNSNIQVVAFEPLKEHRPGLLALGNTDVRSFGLWNENCAMNFNVSSEGGDVGSSFFKIDSGIDSGITVRTDIEVKRFDSLGIEIINNCFLKIDVEGAEYNVLEGFGDLLSKIDMVQLEFSFYDTNLNRNYEIFRILDKYGFTNFIQFGLTYQDQEHKVLGKSDLIFMRNKNGKMHIV